MIKAGPIYSLARPFKWQLGLCLVFLVLESVTSLAVPWGIGKLAAGMFSGLTESLTPIILILMGLFTMQAILAAMRGWVMTSVSEKLLASIRSDIYRRLLVLPISFSQSRRTGEIVSLVTYDSVIISNYISKTLLQILPLVISVVGASVLLMLIEPRLAILFIILPVLNIAIIKLMSKKLKGLAQELRQANADAVASLEENLTNISIIKSFVTEDEEDEEFSQKMSEISSLTTRLDGFNAISRPFVHWVTILCILAFVWIMRESFLNGETPVASIVSFILYAIVLVRPISAIIQTWGQTKIFQGTIGRIKQIYALEVETPSHSSNLDTLEGSIEFRNVQFGYESRNFLLENINLKIQLGETIAIIGENGAGKTTLVNMLLRFINPDSGAVLIDGHPIASFDLEVLRRNIGLVSQNVRLFSGTLMSNILYGSQAPSPDRLKEIIKQAQLEELMLRCPAGLNTQIGDKGLHLSGGEKQKIALARVLVKAPKILILDEPTAMFDVFSEDTFVRDIKSVIENRTVVLISHHPQTLSLADRVFKLKDGQLFECETAEVIVSK